MTVLQAIKLNIYTLRTLHSDESAGYIALVRTSEHAPPSSPRAYRRRRSPQSRNAVTTISLNMSNRMDDYSD
jgi:hypothetical protein